MTQGSISIRLLQGALIALLVMLAAALLVSCADSFSLSATATPGDTERFAAKATLAVQELRGNSGTPQAMAPSAAEVARKQPRRPDTPEQTAFQPFPGSTPAGPGAIAQMQPPFSNSQYHIENSWYSDTANGTRRLVVYAGSIAGPGGQNTAGGVLIVQSLRYVTTASGSAIQMDESGVYTNTAGTGSLHITGADANHVFLQSADGSSYRFDLTNRVFDPIASP